MAETMAAVENDDLSVLDMPLTIRVKKTKNLPEKFSPPISPSLLFSSAVASPHLLNSPSLISPPSSAFVSALQSPYISPRAVVPAAAAAVDNNLQLSPAASCSGSHSEDIPSSSYTPPIKDENPRFSIPDTIPARISFSFPSAPRASFSRRSSSPTPPPPAKLRSCDVYIGFHGQNNNLMRFCKWLKSELELQGIACFVADRARYSDSQSVEITERIICAATYGIVVVAGSTFFNSFSMEEIKVFNQKKNLIPLLFETDVNDVAAFLDRRSDREKPSKICRFQEKEWIEMVEGLIRSHNEFKLEANDSNWRNCISKAVGILKSKLGRKSLAFAKLPEPETEEFPFLRNNNFVGREKELHDLENFFFNESEINKMSFRSSDGFSSDDEHDGVKSKSSFINLEMRKCKEPTLEAWIDPVIELTNRGRSPQKHRQKHRRLKHAGNKKGSVIVLNGGVGVGKTEIALEFAYRYAQRYKTVLWIGGEAKYIRNNVLNLSSKLNLDVTAETHHEHEHERLRVRGFEEQEHDAFQRIKRELFRDVPYLLVIDNLESEKETWDNKDLQDFIPKTTGATHVIITTGLHKVLNFETLAIHPLLLPDALMLLKGKKKKDYPTEELDVLRKFYDRLGRSTFGLGLISCLLHELPITPAELFEAVNRVHLNDSLPDSCPCNCSSSCDDQFYKNNPFLMRAVGFCFDILCSMSAGAKLSHRMVFVSAWFAPSPISAYLLAAAAKSIPESRAGLFDQWKKYVRFITLCSYSNCFIAPQTRKSEFESAILITKLGLARRCNKQSGCWIQFHGITRIFTRKEGGLTAAKAVVQAARKSANPIVNFDHLWATCFLVLGFFKSESRVAVVELKPNELVMFITRVAIPLALHSFASISRCSASHELLRMCTNMLEDVEKSFVSQIQDWRRGGSLCWKKKFHGSNGRVDEYVWQDVTLLKASLLETRAKLLLRGGEFDGGEELCRTCISIRTVMLGHQHSQTLAAQETLAKLVRCRSKI